MSGRPALESSALTLGAAMRDELALAAAVADRAADRALSMVEGDIEVDGQTQQGKQISSGLLRADVVFSTNPGLIDIHLYSLHCC